MRLRWLSPASLLVAVVAFQIVTYLAILPISAHSGQTAIPWMMNQGKVLFGDILEQHAPATSIMAALAQRILPFAPDIVDKLLNLVLVIAITLLIYHLARQISSDHDWAGLLAAGTWAWWSPVYGNVLFYFNTLLAFCILAGIALWLHADSQGRWYRLLLVGVFFGAATLAKQQAWLAVILFGLWLLVYHRRALILYGLGVLVLPAAALLVVAAQGNLENYIFWNWTFNVSGYMDVIPVGSDFLRKLLLSNVLALPFILLMRSQGLRQKYAVLIVLMFIATVALLYPRAGEIAAIAHVPFAAIMSGIVLSRLWRDVQPRSLWLSQTASAVLLGVAATLGAGWLWSGLVMYVPTPLGPGGTPAYDEFRSIVEAVAPLQQPGDTLFVLPETDSTPQLHPMTGMLPSTTWIKGWKWYLEPPGVLDKLVTEWQAKPPTFVIVFPDLLAEGEPGIGRLYELVERDYNAIMTIENILWHGSAIVYHYR